MANYDDSSRAKQISADTCKTGGGTNRNISSSKSRDEMLLINSRLRIFQTALLLAEKGVPEDGVTAER